MNTVGVKRVVTKLLEYKSSRINIRQCIYVSSRLQLQREMDTQRSSILIFSD